MGRGWLERERAIYKTLQVCYLELCQLSEQHNVRILILFCCGVGFVSLPPRIDMLIVEMCTGVCTQ